MRTTIRPASETPWERAKMEQIVRADIAAFTSGRAEMANAMIEQSGIRVRPDRNRGRSAGINPSGRFEPVTRHVFDDGWETLEDLPPFKTEVQVEKPRTIITRNEFARYFLRPLDQSLSRLRARMRLLLRAADAQLHGPVAGAGFRIKAVRQAGRGEAARQGVVEGGLSAAHHRHRHQYRPLPADREAVAHHARDPRSARRAQSPGRHRHEIGAGYARHRHPVAHGRARAGQGCAVGDDARQDAGANDGAARLDADEAAGGDPAVERSRHPGFGDGGADRSRPDRSGDRAHPRRRPRGGRARRRLCAFAGCRSKSARSSRTGCCAIIPTATGT